MNIRAAIRDARPDKPARSARASNGIVVPNIVYEVLASPGKPLDAGARAFFEPRLGRLLGPGQSIGARPAQSDLRVGAADDAHEREAAALAQDMVATPSSTSTCQSLFDLRQVRVHTGDRAAESAAAIGAKAYTTGSHVVLGSTGSGPGRQDVLAHELAHVASSGLSGDAAIRRYTTDDVREPLQYGWNDWAITDEDAAKALDILERLSVEQQATFFGDQEYVERLRDNLAEDRVKEFASLENKIFAIRSLQNRINAYDAIAAPGSGKSFGDVGSALIKRKHAAHDLAVRKSGVGIYVGDHCPTPAPGAIQTNCTNIVLDVLRETFAQQGRTADWAKVEKKYRAYTKARGASMMSGLDVQAALQSEAGWKGIYWSPDSKYEVPREELEGHHPTNPRKGIQSSEAAASFKTAKKDGTYYKGSAGYDQYPGVSVSQLVVDYAPEMPKEPRAAGYPGPSSTPKTTTQLEKLKKLPFGVLAGHGGFHMTIITYGKVIEVKWEESASSLRLFEETNLENWTVGPRSGYHYLASGVIVAPPAELDAAFR